MNYYNEWDKYTAEWLRRLIISGLIPPGDVDERSITEIKAHELTKYTQCHFFAGIGGWSLALRLAGWPASRPVGTGSCPCQPFSAANNGDEAGTADERHLWPAFFDLIRECRALGQQWTDTIFGEQVEAAIKHNWLDGIQADLEGEGYAVGAAVLGSHSVGSPSKRQRLYWVANSDGNRTEPRHNKVPLQPSEDREIRSAISVRGLGGFGDWNSFSEIRCDSGNRYRISSEPGAFPLVNGISDRMGLHHGYGNAINPHTAALFITAAEQARASMRLLAQGPA